MPATLAHELGLLRTLVEHIEQGPLPVDERMREHLHRQGLGHLHEKTGGIVRIGELGRQAFTDLIDCLLRRMPAMRRGVSHVNLQNELFNFIIGYVDREPSSVKAGDLGALLAHIEQWFATQISTRRVFVPCAISRTPAPRFEIGPVVFEFIDKVTTSDFYERDSGNPEFVQLAFNELVQWMQEASGNWLARVTVEGCDQKRGEEIAELAVDLVIVALQLAAPNLDTRTMARLDSRRGGTQKHTLSESNGAYISSWTIKDPGMTIGSGTLFDTLNRHTPIFNSVGNVVRSFASGSFRLPALEQAWCDAAYWLHQALAESIDTIAVAKLETALEVLVTSVSSKGSEKRILEILKTFFDLEHCDPIAPGSQLNAQQYAKIFVGNRSRVLHGTWSTLNHRVPDRAGMESFVTNVLRHAVIELDSYAQSSYPSDDIDCFLGWVRQAK